MIGDNTTTQRITPVRVCGNKTFCHISAGNINSFAIDHQGRAWGWGQNGYFPGQGISEFLGDNTTLIRLTPVRVCGGQTFCHISASVGFSSGNCLSIDSGGRAWGWGYNSQGQLGDSTTTSRLTPVRVCGGGTFCHISAGNRYSLGIDYLGRAWGWGYNSQGQLGDNTTTERITPVRVCGGGTFCHISAGNKYSLGIDYLGRAWGWGYNSQGQLGDNTTTSRLTPVRVCNI
jgi:alpha-tubulin suppressor-like RCC1 family protein